MKDSDGRCRPAYMTDGEIAAELAGETGRRALLVAERQNRRDGRRRARARAAFSAWLLQYQRAGQ